jgi:hypothetical protein
MNQPTLLQSLIAVQECFKKFEKQATIQAYCIEVPKSENHGILARKAARELEESLREFRVASINNLNE